ncbi:hypothetical protein AMTRI_Chr13g123130 [Amborella trichopoda]
MGIKAVTVVFLVFSLFFYLTKAIPNTPLQTQHGTTMKVEEGSILGAQFGRKDLALKVATEFGRKFGGDHRILRRFGGGSRSRWRPSNGAHHHNAGPSPHGSFKWAIFGVLSMWVFLV